MNRLLNPILFLLANTPHAEKNLEILKTMLQATNDSVKNIRNGIDTFQASILKIASSMPGQPAAPSDKGTSPGQAPDPEVKTQPSPEPAEPAWPPSSHGPAAAPEEEFTPEPASPPEPVITADPLTSKEPPLVIQMPAAKPPGNGPKPLR